MRVTVTGATGTLGQEIVAALLGRGDSVTVLSRDAARAGEIFDGQVTALEWKRPTPGGTSGRGPRRRRRRHPPARRADRPALERQGEEGAARLACSVDPQPGRARSSDAEPRPRVLVSQSATGWYGARGDEPLDESTPAASDFLAEIVVAWEQEARAAEELGVRVVLTRTGVVLSEEGGALEKMLPPFKAGVGGPVAGGRQYVPWVHSDDVVGAMLFALDTDAATGPINVVAPDPVTNAELSKALGRVLKRPAIAPVPAFAVKLLYGEMSFIVTTGARAIPKRLRELGYEWQQPDLEQALRAATGR